MSVSVADRLRGSLRFDAVNGDANERGICARQMSQAAVELDRQQATIQSLAEALRHCVTVIESLPEGSLGYDASEGWPHRDELVYNLRAALREAGVDDA